MSEEFAIGKIQYRVEVFYVVFGEDVVLFGERGLHSFWRGGHGGARVRADDFHQWRRQHVVHGEEDDVERLFAMLFLDEVIDVGDADFRWEAGVDGSATGSGAIEIGISVVGVN